MLTALGSSISHGVSAPSQRSAEGNGSILVVVSAEIVVNRNFGLDMLVVIISDSGTLAV